MAKFHTAYTQCKAMQQKVLPTFVGKNNFHDFASHCSCCSCVGECVGAQVCVCVSACLFAYVCVRNAKLSLSLADS